tara:strand:+ start:1465 stop:2409 length:945 start_codon:yes stop_codon:yes gene_type:complete
MKTHIILLFFIISLPFTSIASNTSFDVGRAGFTVSVKGIKNPYSVFSVYVLPDETVTLSSEDEFKIRTDQGIIEEKQATSWEWKAPSVPGLYPINLQTNDNSKNMVLNIFVMRPSKELKDGKLDGYNIGNYPSKPFKGLPIYGVPKGFIEVTEQNINTAISPHFTLGQFLCKQPSTASKKFLILRPELLLKLERILQEVNKQGYVANSFFIMSGYRTPFYNNAIGNGKYSRHIYGGAADIYIDTTPRDGSMDDLNKDGKINRKDAAVLYDLIEKLSKQEGWKHIGGLGEYGVSHTHGPFVHVDARGFRARWGKN